ncbi:hypothetical protein PACTADRAFT_53347 [Pachysolen tannophilus NRRL Y-2460]|uniref:60S acidic ribosomal protein P1 n=1 Tax=Pachysolen tannophilus NRRL Y-2460 TaxID=669874 RepID=A0A1E4U2D2_PACTA|nr:hypothetical protein PACTADRAFT_53347 [Pachysolen tannophilus NRRL Y-2460]
MSATTEQSLSYAALILADSEIEITSDKLMTLLSNAEVGADKIWADIYAKALEGKNLKDFFFNFSSGPASVAASGATGGAAAGEAAAEAEEEKEEAAKEESDDDMGFGLFD